ncbi:DNA primase [Syntrophomonas erecta]
MALYNNQIVREIEDRLEILDIVAETVNLVRKGNRYWGICPFHQEKTPSFCVTPEKNMFYCFGCHAGGDMFSFIMKRDGLQFPEALELLARRAGVELAVPRAGSKEDRRGKVLAVNQAAAEFYQQVLLNTDGRQARKYLQQRGVLRETAEKFKLGYAPAGWNRLEEYLFKKGFSEQYVKLSGLIKRNEQQNRFYDLFRERIIFPIQNHRGEVVGFGGRVLDASLPKYLNTPETELFSKRHNLYGLYQARQSIRAQNSVLLVEGYMDCIKLYQAGVENVVASLGTALTRDQGVLIRRYAEEVIILFDGDEAGQRETMRAIEVLAAEQLRIWVVSLPGGKDPDEYMELFGKEEFLQYIQNNRLSYIEFKINRYINNAKDLTLQTKIKIIQRLKEDIRRLDSEIAKEHYTRILAQKLELEQNLVSRELKAERARKEGIKRNKTKIVRDNIEYGNYSLEEKILAAMLFNPRIFGQIKAAIGLNFTADSEYRQLLQYFNQIEGNPKDRLDELNIMARENGLEAVLARLVMLGEDGPAINQVELTSFIKRVQLRRAEQRWQRMYRTIKNLETSGDFDSLLRFILDIDTFLNDTQRGGIR